MLTHTRLSEALRGSSDHRRKAALNSKPQVGSSGDRFGKDGSARCSKARPAARAAAVYSQKQQILIHLTSLERFDLFRCKSKVVAIWFGSGSVSFLLQN
jgi:hypothetical protein